MIHSIRVRRYISDILCSRGLDWEDQISVPLIHPNARDQYKGNGRFRTGISRPHRGSSTIKEKTVGLY